MRTALVVTKSPTRRRQRIVVGFAAASLLCLASCADGAAAAPDDAAAFVDAIETETDEAQVNSDTKTSDTKTSDTEVIDTEISDTAVTEISDTEGAAEEDDTQEADTDAGDAGAGDAGADGTDADDAALDVVSFTLDSGTERTIARIANGEEPPLPEGAIEQTIAFEGQEIRTIEIPGAEPAIVLMHGFPDSLHLHDQLYPLLAGRRMIAFDWIGWGQSSKPLPGTYRYDANQQMKELEAVMDGLDLDQVVLVAHDASGPPAIDYAGAHPDRVAELVILNAYYGFDPGLTPPKAIEIHGDPTLDDVERVIDLDPAAAEALYRFQISEFITNPAQAGEVDVFWSQFGEAFPAFVALNDSLFVGVISRNTPEAFAKLDMPVRVAFGASDPYLSAELGEYFAELAPFGELLPIEGAGHFPQVDAPELVAKVILNES